MLCSRSRATWCGHVRCNWKARSRVKIAGLEKHVGFGFASSQRRIALASAMTMFTLMAYGHTCVRLWTEALGSALALPQVVRYLHCQPSRRTSRAILSLTTQHLSRRCLRGCLDPAWQSDRPSLRGRDRGGNIDLVSAAAIHSFRPGAGLAGLLLSQHLLP